MVRHLTLLTYTDQGVANVEASSQRAAEFRAQVEAAGGKVTSMYWSLGNHDGCFILETPDEATAVTLLLRLSKAGNVRTETMRIFDETEFAALSSNS